MRGRLCTTIAAATAREMAEKAGLALRLGSELVEFRLDRLSSWSLEEAVLHLGPYADRAIFTHRHGAAGLEAILEVAGRLKPLYVDLELPTLRSNRGLAEEIGGERLIASWHNPHATPDEDRLLEIWGEASSYGMAKIVTMANEYEDNLRILSLYRRAPGGRLIAFCMGERGVLSRVIAPTLGCPIIYACLPGEALAPGQLSIETWTALRRLVNPA